MKSAQTKDILKAVGFVSSLAYANQCKERGIRFAAERVSYLAQGSKGGFSHTHLIDVSATCAASGVNCHLYLSQKAESVFPKELPKDYLNSDYMVYIGSNSKKTESAASYLEEVFILSKFEFDSSKKSQDGSLARDGKKRVIGEIFHLEDLGDVSQPNPAINFLGLSVFALIAQGLACSIENHKEVEETLALMVEEDKEILNLVSTPNWGMF